VSVGPGQDNAEWRATGIDDKVALRTRLTPIGRVRTSRRPSFLPPGLRCRVPHGSNPVVRHRPATLEKRAAGPPTRPPSANHAAVVNTTFPSRIPSPAAGTPTANRYAARTGYQSAPPGPGSVAAHPSDAPAPVAAAARSPSRDRRERGTSPCPTKAPTAGFVRRS
jgi:hypothetical protein